MPAATNGQTAASARERLLASLVEAIQDLVLVIDRDHRVILSNWRGFGPPTPTGPAGEIYCFQVLRHRSEPCEACHVQKAFATGQVQEVELINPLNGRSLEVLAFPVFEGDRVTLVVVHARDVTSRRQVEAGVRQAHGILAAVAFAAQQFLQAPGREENLQEFLGQLGRAAEVSRVYIFQNHPGPEGVLLTSQRFEWTAEGVKPQIDNPDLHNFPWQDGGMGRWQDLLSRGDVVVGDVEDFPASEREILASQGIQSILAAPLFVGQEWWGFIGFDECRVKRQWSEAEIYALKTAAGIIGAAFFRQQAENALAQSELKYRTLVEQIPAITYITTWNAETALYISPQVEHLLGFMREEWLVDPTLWIRQLHPEDRERVLAELARCCKSGEPFAAEYRMFSKEGDIVWLRDEAWMLRDKAGQPLYLQGVAVDITARKRAEEELRESEARFRRLFDDAADAIFLHDRGKIVEVNREACQSLGYTREQLLTMNILDVQMDHREELPRIWAKGASHPETILGRHRRQDGSIFPVEVRATEFDWHGRRLRLALVRDISERRRGEAEIRAYQEMLRSLAAELALTEERERRRLAEDLHDHIGQLLALAKVKLGAVSRDIREPAFKSDVKTAREFLEEAINAVRSLTFELSVPILYEVGLEEALDWLAEQFERRHGLNIRVRRYSETLPLTESARGMLFRIVRELLANVVKHSGAPEVSLVLEKNEEKLSIEVKDNGLGFDIGEVSSKMTERKGFGLFSVRERLGSMGGQMEIHSAPGQGTRVSLSVPLSAVLDFQGGKS